MCACVCVCLFSAQGPYVKALAKGFPERTMPIKDILKFVHQFAGKRRKNKKKKHHHPDKAIDSV